MAKLKDSEARKSHTVMLTDSEVEKIAELANKLGISRSLLMRNLLLIGLDDIKTLDKTGFLATCIHTEKLYKKIRDKIIKYGEESISADDFKQ